jgi:hypothetical protein
LLVGVGCGLCPANATHVKSCATTSSDFTPTL